MTDIISLESRHKFLKRKLEKRMLGKAQSVINNVLDMQPNYDDLISVLEMVLKFSFTWRHLYRAREREIGELRKNTEELEKLIDNAIDDSI